MSVVNIITCIAMRLKECKLDSLIWKIRDMCRGKDSVNLVILKV